MLITNKTSVTLKISGESLESKKTREFPEALCDTMRIESSIGSCVIKTLFSKRTFENRGKLIAREGSKKDANGTKIVLVSAN